MPAITLEELMEAGVHFGHQTNRWNPKMKPYIWGKRNGIYIIDLTQTVPLFEQAYEFVKQQSALGKKILFVGSKKQAHDIVASEADRVGALYVNKRWLGGTLTNAAVVKTRIARLRELEDMEANGQFEKVGKKEAAVHRRSLAKLTRSLGGLKDFRGELGAMVVIDQKKELNAVLEAKKAGVPTICLLDTNADPSLCQFNVPGNDDALKAVHLIVTRLAEAVLEGKALREAQIAGQKDEAKKVADAAIAARAKAAVAESPAVVVAEATSAEVPAPTAS
ncbi:MAG: 30S ribosomal protein S2 [Vampirovibrio sp.]|nr:30S ribosomal protein S2 [Vampirovibrio sp.]